MMKFKFLLWMMPKLMQRAINTKPACARYVVGKNLEFQIQTADKTGRYFRIQDGKVKSFAGLMKSPKFTLTFRNADKGFKILSAKDGKEAFLAALHDEDLVISGDFVEVLWFQGFTEYLQPDK
ncbi:MAG: helicase [Polaromonas sp.]|nr:helicase [Polaromonas sp.]